MTRTPRRPVVLGTAAASLLLLLAAPTPSAALGQLRDAGDATDSSGPLVAAVALLAWVLALWLVLVALLTLAGRLPGLAGQVFGAVSRRVAPAALRRAVEVALGLTVAVGVLGASPASAAVAPETGAAPPAAAASLDWSAPVAAPALDWSATPTSTPPATDLDWPTDAPPTESVVVQPGDTLWDLAERSLQEAGDDAPSDTEIAQAWPSWWSANREVVGEDPDLLQPGTRLSPPPAPDAPGSAGPASS